MAAQASDMQLLHTALSQLHTLKGLTESLTATSLLADFGTDTGKKRIEGHFKGLATELQAIQHVWKDVLAALHRAQDTSISVPDMTQSTREQLTSLQACRQLANLAYTALDEAVDMQYIPVGSMHQTKRPRKATSGPEDIEALQTVLQKLNSSTIGVNIHLFGRTSIIPDKVSVKHATEIRLVCPRVLCASITLAAPGMPEVVRVVVDSASRAARIDGWSMPEAQVFRRLSYLAVRVLQYFRVRAENPVNCLLSKQNASSSPLEGQSTAAAAAAPTISGARTPYHAGAAALEDLILWLACYKDLFSRPCAETGTLLAVESCGASPQPPYFRPYKLPTARLLHLAQHPQDVVAYHMHAAPQHMLGWSESTEKELEPSTA